MASLDTIILLIVDYRAAIGGGKTSVTSLPLSPEDLYWARLGRPLPVRRPSSHDDSAVDAAGQ